MKNLQKLQMKIVKLIFLPSFFRKRWKERKRETKETGKLKTIKSLIITTSLGRG